MDPVLHSATETYRAAHAERMAAEAEAKAARRAMDLADLRLIEAQAAEAAAGSALLAVAHD